MYYDIGYRLGLHCIQLDPKKIESLTEEQKREIFEGHKDGKYDWEHLFDELEITNDVG